VFLYFRLELIHAVPFVELYESVTFPPPAFQVVFTQKLPVVTVLITGTGGMNCCGTSVTVTVNTAVEVLPYPSETCTCQLYTPESVNPVTQDTTPEAPFTSHWDALSEKVPVSPSASA